jgi:hypothetical protein
MVATTPSLRSVAGATPPLLRKEGKPMRASSNNQNMPHANFPSFSRRGQFISQK